ncbi:MAG TPA: RNA polymerase sigma factor [Candidatus Saccharimonadales bacterium]|nr:RNA polymerase sigma factor [Candidatus Saccharimonadales bacterium]
MQEFVLNPPARLLSADPAEKAGVDSTEFEHRLRECGPLAFRMARAVLRNDADAEEVAQEALLRAYRKWEDLRDPARFRAWVVRISFRLALDRWRSVRRRERRETAWAAPGTQPAPRTAEQVAVSNEFQARLERALDELADKSRLVVILSAIHGYTLEEVAAILEIPVGTVKSKLFHARKRLAEKLR